MGVQWRKENPNPRVHRSSGKLGEPRFPLERVDPRVGIFLSPLDTHDGFYLSLIIKDFCLTYTEKVHNFANVYLNPVINSISWGIYRLLNLFFVLDDSLTS